MRKFIYHERPGALKTREGDAAKDKRIRARERVKRLGFFVEAPQVRPYFGRAGKSNEDR